MQVCIQTNEWGWIYLQIHRQLAFDVFLIRDNKMCYIIRNRFRILKNKFEFVSIGEVQPDISEFDPPKKFLVSDDLAR